MYSIREIVESVERSVAVCNTIKDPILKCNVCAGTGFSQTVIHDKQYVGRCECRREADLSFGIPKLYQAARITDFPADRVKNIVEWLENPETSGLLINGSVGVGKTHLACALARYVRENGRGVSFRTA